ncbi:MAG: hypothetical protein ABJA71_10160 [Ginsengibacter sp.]
MKKPTRNTSKKNKSSVVEITTTLFEQSLLETLVEELAYRRVDIGYSRESVPVGRQAIETSSIEAYVSGEMNISDKSDLLNMPFTTCFLFTCIKIKGGEYKFSWCNSLS